MATPNVRSNQLHAELAFDDWFVRFRYGPSVCSPRWADQTSGAQGPLGLPRLLRPGFQVSGSPRIPAGYHYDAKLRIASAGLSPASTAASLAAPPSPSFAWRNNPTLHATRTSWAGNVGLRCANPTYGLPEHRCPSSHRSVKWPWCRSKRWWTTWTSCGPSTYRLERSTAAISAPRCSARQPPLSDRLADTPPASASCESSGWILLL